MMGFFGFPLIPRYGEFSTNALRKELATITINWQWRLAVLGDVRFHDGDASDIHHLMGVARVCGLAMMQ